MKNKKIHIACVMGTRPEVIKMAPIIHACKKNPAFKTTVINTAQHRDLIDDMLQIVDLNPDIDMNIMQEKQTLTSLTGQLFLKFEPIIAEHHFDVILAQGDTTTTFVASMAAFYHKIRFGHVEAGLRSGDYYQPFPEEMNRVLTSKLATWHFAPTEVEAAQLKKEGVSTSHIFVTGNSVIDSLHELSKRNAATPFALPKDKRIILVTLHRRESFGEPIKNIFAALIQLANTFSDIDIYYPVHPNPNVKDIAHQMLGGQTNIHLLKPMQYDQFVTLMKASYLILSDSGGIQEEAPALGKPVLILREKTERPLVVEKGLGKLVGSNTQLIVDTAANLLTDSAAYAQMAQHISPYGDGHTAQRIVDIIQQAFEHPKGET